MIAARFAMAISTFLAKPIALTGFAVNVFYDFGIMDQHCNHVDVLYAVAPLIC